MTRLEGRTARPADGGALRAGQVSLEHALPPLPSAPPDRALRDTDCSASGEHPPSHAAAAAASAFSRAAFGSSNGAAPPPQAPHAAPLQPPPLPSWVAAVQLSMGELFSQWVVHATSAGIDPYADASEASFRGWLKTQQHAAPSVRTDSAAAVRATAFG
jgi:hypothetical protein